MTTPPNSPALIYGRISKLDSNSTESQSVKDQIDRCRGYCQAQKLSLIAEPFTDLDVTGSIPISKRPAGALLLKAIKEHGVKAVVVLKLDRMFRNAGDCLTVTQHWADNGVALHIVDFGGMSIDIASPMGRMFLTISAGFAELERNMIAERTTSALSRKCRNREKTGGWSAPYGYEVYTDSETRLNKATKTIEPVKKLRPLPSEQAVIFRVKELRALAKTKWTDICQILTDAGSLSRTKKPFIPTQLKRMVDYSVD